MYMQVWQTPIDICTCRCCERCKFAPPHRCCQTSCPAWWRQWQSRGRTCKAMSPRSCWPWRPLWTTLTWSSALSTSCESCSCPRPTWPRTRWRATVGVPSSAPSSSTPIMPGAPVTRPLSSCREVTTSQVGCCGMIACSPEGFTLQWQWMRGVVPEFLPSNGRLFCCPKVFAVPLHDCLLLRCFCLPVT